MHLLADCSTQQLGRLDFSSALVVVLRAAPGACRRYPALLSLTVKGPLAKCHELGNQELLTLQVSQGFGVR